MQTARSARRGGRLGGPALGALLLGMACVGGCSSSLEGSSPDAAIAPDGAADLAPHADLTADAARPADGSPPPADAAPPPPPTSYTPCQVGSCWDAPALSGACGTFTVNENYSTGLYNVHRYPLTAPAKVDVEVKLERTAGAWSPALVLHDAAGATVHDGERSLSDSSLVITPLSTGKSSGTAGVRITAAQDTDLTVFATGWQVIDGGFAPSLPTEAKYALSVFADCTPPPPGKLLSPPNFDPNDVKNGYYLLPDSQPPGLYTHKAEDCSRGTKLLIDVLYTVAYHWHTKRPSLSPISILDLNEGSCSTVDHATHDDGTHVDIIAGCATEVACSDNQPAIDLAKLIIDTGEACGIINNNTAIQPQINAYFSSKFSYTPWHGTFMRSVSGHTHHFHIRVKKPDGTCN